MDDDLFGGLPAVSKTENGSGRTGNAIPPVLAAAPNKLENTTAPKPAAAQGENVAEKRKAGSSLVSSLGTAGTSMAFLPQAIRKKKKPSKQPQRTSIKRNIVVEKSMPENGSETNHHNIESSSPPQRINMAISEIKSGHGATHEISNSNEDQPTDNNPQHTDDGSDNNNEPYLENEPESLRLLHASVKDPYDPHFPNDYLAYRERKKTEQVRKDLQRSALQRLDAQEKLRKKIEEERKRLLESGELGKLAESHASGGVEAASAGMTGSVGAAGRGRGRGRGVANLPAWLVKKQQDQKEAEAEAEGADVKPVSKGQFDDSGQF